MERKGKFTPCRGTKNRKGTNSGESGVRNLEAESIRSRAESTGLSLNLKTVTAVTAVLVIGRRSIRLDVTFVIDGALNLKNQSISFVSSRRDLQG